MENRKRLRGPNILRTSQASRLQYREQMWKKKLMEIYRSRSRLEPAPAGVGRYLKEQHQWILCREREHSKLGLIQAHLISTPGSTWSASQGKPHMVPELACLPLDELSYNKTGNQRDRTSAFSWRYFGTQECFLPEYGRQSGWERENPANGLLQCKPSLEKRGTVFREVSE